MSLNLIPVFSIANKYNIERIEKIKDAFGNAIIPAAFFKKV
jgi:hypothetical protein